MINIIKKIINILFKKNSLKNISKENLRDLVEITLFRENNKHSNDLDNFYDVWMKSFPEDNKTK